MLWQVFLPQAGHGTSTGKSIGSDSRASREPLPMAQFTDPELGQAMLRQG